MLSLQQKNCRWRTLGFTEAIMSRKEQDYIRKQPLHLFYSFDYIFRFALIHLVVEYDVADHMYWKK